MINLNTIAGVMIPFVGTSLGSAMVFFLKDKINDKVQKALLGFAAGVMMAASVWSLLRPSMDMSGEAGMGKLSFLPAVVGLAIGVFFLLFMDRHIPHLHLDSESPEGPSTSLGKTAMMILAVVIHNVPEGMAVGVVFAGLGEANSMTLAGAFALSLGIAIQNFPEGAIISMPLKANAGMKKGKAFVYGVLSGAVEPIGAILTILISGILIPILPYLLSFAAGAMIYVVVEELIPESAEGEHSNIGTIGFALGFAVMMILDVALG